MSPGVFIPTIDGVECEDLYREPDRSRWTWLKTSVSLPCGCPVSCWTPTFLLNSLKACFLNQTNTRLKRCKFSNCSCLLPRRTNWNLPDTLKTLYRDCIIHYRGQSRFSLDLENTSAEFGGSFTSSLRKKLRHDTVLSQEMAGSDEISCSLISSAHLFRRNLTPVPPDVRYRRLRFIFKLLFWVSGRRSSRRASRHVPYVCGFSRARDETEYGSGVADWRRENEGCLMWSPLPDTCTRSEKCFEAALEALTLVRVRVKAELVFGGSRNMWRRIEVERPNLCVHQDGAPIETHTQEDATALWMALTKQMNLEPLYVQV